jgi:hypothetical protein
MIMQVAGSPSAKRPAISAIFASQYASRQRFCQLLEEQRHAVCAIKYLIETKLGSTFPPMISP